METRTLVNSSYKKHPLTDFKSVTPDTPLEHLNLNWRERDLPESVRTKHVHRLHPYLGKFIPQITEIFLRKYCPKLVYDPFSGSGTTLVEANTLGIASVGCDISAFNCLLSKVKTDEYDLRKLERGVFDSLRKLSEFRRDSVYNPTSVNRFHTNNRYLREWFAPRALQELLFYKSIIENYEYQDFFKIVLTRSARSARLTTHFDLDFPKKPRTEPYECYKHGRICHPVQEAFKFLTRYSLDALDRVKEFACLRTKAKVSILHADSRTVEVPPGIDCVITSPPYVGLIDYHGQHKYAYELLGLPNNEGGEIGAASKGQSEEARTEYINEINRVFLHTRDFMSKNAVMVIIMGDKYNLYNAAKIGFREEGRIERHVNRRTGRRQGAFYESVLIWRKV